MTTLEGFPDITDMIEHLGIKARGVYEKFYSVLIPLFRSRNNV